MGLNIASRAAAVSVLGMATAPAWGYGRSYYYGPGMMYGGGWGGGIFAWLMMFLVVALIVVLVIGVVRWIFGSGHRPPLTPQALGRTALDILEERFARGEIDKEEFEEKRRVLSK